MFCAVVECLLAASVTLRWSIDSLADLSDHGQYRSKGPGIVGNCLTAHGDETPPIFARLRPKSSDGRTQVHDVRRVFSNVARFRRGPPHVAQSRQHLHFRSTSSQSRATWCRPWPRAPESAKFGHRPQAETQRHLPDGALRSLGARVSAGRVCTNGGGETQGPTSEGPQGITTGLTLVKTSCPSRGDALGRRRSNSARLGYGRTEPRASLYSGTATSGVRRGIGRRAVVHAPAAR